MRKRVAIYCRLSEEDKNKQNPDDDSGSIQNQKAMLQDHANRMGWEIYEIYSDDDYTGADRNRPAFKRMIADAKAGKFDIILCKTLSRFTREMELVEKYIHGLFLYWNIRFVSIVDNIDTEVKGNKKARQINGLVNEWYLEDMSDNIRAALDSRRKNGFHIGSFALYGYKKDPDQKGHLIIDPEAAAVVREVFTLFSQGYGKTAIAQILNDRGIPNPTEYKRLQGLRYQRPNSRNSTLWKYFAISDMLTNEIYIGNMVQGKTEKISYKNKDMRARPKDQWYVVEGTHEAIIDRDLWNRVQALVAERAKPFSVGKIGLFAKKVRCAGCGYVLRSSKSKGKHFLQCPNHHVAKDACEGAFISVERLERSVIDELNQLTATYLDMDELEREVDFCADLRERKEQIECETVVYRQKIDEISKGLKTVYKDKLKGLIGEEDFVELSNDFHAQKDRLEAQIKACEKQIEEIDAKIDAGDNRREILEEYVNVEHLTREMVDALIDEIRVGKRISGTRIVPIEIRWKF